MWTRIAGLAAMAMVFSGEAMALPRLALPVPVVPRESFLRDGGTTAAQLSFESFCSRYPGQCAGDGRPATIHLDGEKWNELDRINRGVNARIVPDAVADHTNWSIETTRGDCNDYAVQKRKALIDAGWPAGAVALTVVRTPWDRAGLAHMVVTVRTDQGDLVLDNLRRDIRPWYATGYRAVMRQSAEDPRVWVRTFGGRHKLRRAVHTI